MATRTAEDVEMRACDLAAMVAHARTEDPRECCGLLVGQKAAERGTIRVGSIVPTTNLELGTTRYLVDPAQHFALLKRLRGTPDCIVGTYHSHPRSPAIPSAADQAEASPEFVHVIISLVDSAAPERRAYRVDGRGFRELPIVVVGSE